MKFLAKIVALASMSLLPYLGYAQNITNVDANQEGKAIAITYDLGEKSNVALYVTNNNGKNKRLIPFEFTSGDIGKKITPGKNKKILWKVLEQYPNQNFEQENISFIVKGKITMKTFVQINGSYSIDSGSMLGFTVGQLGQFGWYVKGNLTPSVPYKTDYICDETGFVGDTMPAYSGNYSSFKYYGIGGFSIRLGIPLYLNAGLGYGVRRLYWETSNHKWVSNASGSYSGLAIDAGISTTFKKVVLSAGITSTKSNIDVNIGVGCAF